MFYLYGQNALSTFRCQLLNQKLHLYGVQILQAQHLYFVDSIRTLQDDEQQTLASIVSAREPLIDNSDHFIVIPRLGTQSPWSSKATDILHNCNLPAIERIERGIIYFVTKSEQGALDNDLIGKVLYDPLVETLITDIAQAKWLFKQASPNPHQEIDIKHHGRAALEKANQEQGLALNEHEIDYLLEHFGAMKKNPTDAELMMFAQANSEHCRHKIFNADWEIDKQKMPSSLFKMIKNTYAASSDGVLSAYHDNAAVMRGYNNENFYPNSSQRYDYHGQNTHVLMKVETHNHPTAIAPYPGAATGSGGEIRDEGATGRGAKPKAGLCGFSVSNLRIPNYTHDWEDTVGKPTHMASPLDIMLQGPIGAAAYNNEFGRPNLCGYFRTLELKTDSLEGENWRGFHKPIMIAGGMGNILDESVDKVKFEPGAVLIVLGGPAMLIGLGGGAASSMASGQSDEALDFASVQRPNPEMERRAQEVINHCWQQAEDNPILAIHDVGAGGLSNALPELLADSARGGNLKLRAIPNAEIAMPPMAIWCNEAQERYVLAIDKTKIEAFDALAQRERCPYAIVGHATAEDKLELHDATFDTKPIDMPMSVLLGKLPTLNKRVKRQKKACYEQRLRTIDLHEAASKVLQLPCVASKQFLITIGDRSVGGLVAQDQMVGPWQVPVSDVAVTHGDFKNYHGEAMAMGERSPIALYDVCASVRMAIAESITNIAAANIEKISDIKLSANWMASCAYEGEEANLYDAVWAVGMELCPALGICIPVGKDSLSMRTQWTDQGQRLTVDSPLSLIVSAFAVVSDVRQTLTPLLNTEVESSELILIDLSKGKNRLGGSALAQVYGTLGGDTPDLDEPEDLRQFFKAIQDLRQNNLLMSYHDRSDGGLFACLCEMAFASRVGLDIQLDELGDDPLSILFNEELGAVLQVPSDSMEYVLELIEGAGLGQHTTRIGRWLEGSRVSFRFRGQEVLAEDLSYWLMQWHETSYQLQALRDNPKCAQQERAQCIDTTRVGLNTVGDPGCTLLRHSTRPPVAILREQGVNGHIEMANAFDKAGFQPVDVHMSDLLNARQSLTSFVGVIACGGFSYGDVFGAGSGWANTILHNPELKEMFTAFFNREDTFSLGICNGCQMLSQLQELIPGADGFPNFIRNESEQFEARLSLVEILDSPSWFLSDLAGYRLPVAVAHGEGRIQWREQARASSLGNKNACMRYVDPQGQATQDYPYNPNGSERGNTGFTTADGRVTIMMPHPERCIRKSQLSWAPKEWNEYTPWLKMFQACRAKF